MKLSISKTILAAGILSLWAVSIIDARQRGGPQQPGALPKLTKVRDDIYGGSWAEWTRSVDSL
jgi:hypothetical protein